MSPELKVSEEDIEEYFCLQNRCDGLTMAGCQVPTKLLSLSFSRKTGGENKMKRFVCQEEDNVMDYQLLSWETHSIWGKLI